MSTELQSAFSDEQTKLAQYSDKFTALQGKFGINGSVLKHVDILEQRLARLNQEKQKVTQKLGDIDDVLARYAIWTGAISGMEADNPILDEMAFRLEDDNKSSLLNAPCEALEQYYSKVNGELFRVKAVVADDSRSSIGDLYGSVLLAYFQLPPIAQTLFVTLFLGTLGALTINVLRLSRIGWWAEQTEPLWGEIALSPLLGALAAFGIFLLGSTGLLLTGDIKSGSGGAVSLSAFFIGLLGFVSGLLYDEAFGRVRRFGVQLFGADERPMGPTQIDSSLADTLRSAGYPLAAELALRTRLGTTVAPLNEFTILLPADDSLSSVSLAEWTELTGSVPSPKLNGWRLHHISNKRMLSSDVLGSRSGGTTTELVLQDGTKLKVGFAIDGLTINGLKVVRPDIVWGNGVVHLLPADL